MILAFEAGREGQRGVSISVNYVLALGISALLVTGLLIAGGGFVEDQRERVIEAELEVVGQHLAGNMEQVDRYVHADEDQPAAAYVNQTFQRSVTGSTYTIELEEDPDRIVLSATELDVTVTVQPSVNTDLDSETSFAGGGTVTAAYDESANNGDGGLVIRNV